MKSTMTAICRSSPMARKSSFQPSFLVFTYRTNKRKRERSNEAVPYKLTTLCNLIGRSDSRNNTKGIGLSSMHTVEAFGIFSEDLPPSTTSTLAIPQPPSPCWLKSSDSLKEMCCFLIQYFSCPTTHTLLPTQTDPFHIGKEAVIYYPVIPAIAE